VGGAEAPRALSASEEELLRSHRCFDRYLYVFQRWPELLAEFPGSPFAPLAYLKYSHHTPDNTRTDVPLKYAEYVRRHAARLDPGFVKAVAADHLRVRFMAGRYAELTGMEPATAAELWYSALASRATGDTDRALALLKRLTAMDDDPYLRDQARVFLTDHYYGPVPLTSMYYFLRLLRKGRADSWGPTALGFFSKVDGSYTRRGLGDYQETYLSERDIERFLEEHGDPEFNRPVRQSLAMRYLRQFQFDDAARLAQPVRDDDLLGKIRAVRARYSVDTDAGLYATGAWFFRAEDGIFSSDTTSYEYETAGDLAGLQEGYLGQLNKYLIARKMFRTLIRRYPDSRLIDQAHYSSALCDLRLISYHTFFGKFRAEFVADAVGHFVEVYHKAPRSPLADDALYWAGYFAETDRDREYYWDRIRKEYPDGDIMRQGLPLPRHR